MAKKTKPMQKKTLSSPDEVRTFDKGKVELATVGGITFGRASFEPGWKWSESVKPIVKTEYCEAPQDRKSTRLNSSHSRASRMPSSA